MSRPRILPVVLGALLALAIAPAAQAANGLVAAYGFEEASGNTATDGSGSGSNGTLTGAIRVTNGRFGKALSFDGAGDYVRVPDGANLDLTTGMTLEAWVKPTSGSGYKSVILKEKPGDLAYALYGSAPGAPSAQLTYAGGYKLADGPSALPVNVWSHIAATYDGATLKLFVNGAQVASVAYAGSLPVSNNDLYIGGNSVWTEWFDGLIDEVRVYNRALTATEIQADMAAPVVPGTPPEPVEQPPTPDKVGSWTPPVNWPLVAVHAAMLSNGKVAMWDAFGAAMGSERIWDPATGQFASTPSGVNLFCAGHVLLPDGRLFTAGGHLLAYVGITDTELLNPLTGSWTAGPQMSRGRWYPTATTLPDGRVLIVSGDGIPDSFGPYNAFYKPSDTIPEIYDPATNTIKQVPTAARRMPLYPFMFVTPDGRVVDAGPDTTTRLLDLQTGQWSALASKSPIDGHSAVMYRPGKILKSGTWSDPDFPSDNPVTNRAAVLDLNQTVPTWQEVSPMKWRRTFHTLTVLPDGDVLAMGGTQTPHGDDVTNSAVLEPEIWHPATDTWTSMASSVRPRGYHNTSLLLPDGRILLAGSGRLDGSLMPNEQTAEIFSPPYLHKGTRPTISYAPDHLQYGKQFTIMSPDAASITKVSLVRTGAVTHGLNMDQRYQELNFSVSGNTLTVDGPGNPNTAPPGVYYVFILNDKGVPSVASMVPLLNTGDTTAPSAPTGVTATGAANAVNLSWTAATDNVGVKTYNVYRSTTSGFTPDVATKIASVATTSYKDTGRTPGTTYYYRVIAEDAAGNIGDPSAEASGTALADTTAPAVAVTAPAAGSTVRGSVSLTASASDDVAVAGVQFKIDGNDLGSEDTSAPYSATWDASALSGGHTITAVARDTTGNKTTSVAVGVTVDNSVPAGPAPVAAYAFDETSGTTATDATGRGHTGTVNGATRTTTGKFGGALSFNGTSNTVTIADANDLDLTTGMTVEAWVNPTAVGGGAWRTVLMKEKSGGLAYGLYANSDTNRPSAHVNNGAETDTRGTAQLTANTWTHLAATYDGATLRIYVNGTQASSKPVTGSLVNGTGALRIGGNSVWGEYFQGQIDDVRIYNIALTAAQIQADETNPVGGAPTPDTTAPTVPANVTATGGVGSVALQWNTSTDNVGVVRYSVYRSTATGFTPSAANRVAQVTGTTYNDAGLAPGTYYYRVAAEDAAGNASVPSLEASGTATTDSTGPAVSVTAPTAGSTVKGSVAVAATASDNVGVAGVQFKLDGANLGNEDTTAPYSVAWDTTAAAAGPHTLTAVARDAAGNSTTSGSVAVTVDNSVPAGPVPVAAYNFDETTGTTATDVTGHGHTGTINGATRTTTGKYGGALSFNGTSNTVVIPDASDLDLTTGMTIEAWVNLNAAGGGAWRTVLMKEGTGGLAYGLYANSSTNRPSAHVNNGAETDTRGTAQLAANTWTHLAATYDGATLRIYVNGTQASSKAVTGSLINGTGALRIGGNSIWGEYLNGQIDDVRVYNTALTQTQIQTDRNTPVA